MSLRATAQAIADAVEAGVTLTEVYPRYNPHAGPGSAVVVPDDDWIRFDPDGGYCDPDVRFRVVLLMGVGDILESMEWFEARLAELVAAFAADSTLGGAVDGIGVESASAPEQVTVPGRPDLVQIVVNLTPVSLDGISA
jgi:hypothetical protein